MCSWLLCIGIFLPSDVASCFDCNSECFIEATPVERFDSWLENTLTLEVCLKLKGDRTLSSTLVNTPEEANGFALRVVRFITLYMSEVCVDAFGAWKEEPIFMEESKRFLCALESRLVLNVVVRLNWLAICWNLRE